MKTPKVLERTVKDAVKKRLRELGCYQFWPVQMGLGTRTLDCLGCCRECFFAIECKAPGKKMTLAQERTADIIRAAGGAILFIDSVEKAKAINRDDLMRSGWPMK